MAKQGSGGRGNKNNQNMGLLPDPVFHPHPLPHHHHHHPGGRGGGRGHTSSGGMKRPMSAALQSAIGQKRSRNEQNGGGGAAGHHHQHQHQPQQGGRRHSAPSTSTVLYSVPSSSGKPPPTQQQKRGAGAAPAGGGGGGMNVFLSPREGDSPQGVALGFNYWVHQRTKILASDLRDLVIYALTNQSTRTPGNSNASKPTSPSAPPAFIRQQDIGRVNKVIVATISGLPPPQAVGELPSCPFLSSLTAAPTRYTNDFDQTPRPEHALSAAASMLWTPQSPVPLHQIRALASLTKAFTDYVLFMTSDGQTSRPEDRLLFRVGNLEELEAASVKSELEEGEEADEEQQAEVRGLFYRLRGGDRGTWSLRKGGELRLKWTNKPLKEQEEVYRVEPWVEHEDASLSLLFIKQEGPSPHHAAKKQKIDTQEETYAEAAAAADGERKKKETTTTTKAVGAAATTAAAAGVVGVTESASQLSLVEAIHLDHFEGWMMADSTSNLAVGGRLLDHDDDGLLTVHTPLDLPACKEAIDQASYITDEYIVSFALTEQERLRQRYPMSLSVEGSGWVATSPSSTSKSATEDSSSSSSKKAKAWESEGFDPGDWMEEDDNNEGEKEEREEEEGEMKVKGKQGEVPIKEEEKEEREKKKKTRRRRARLLGIDCEMCETGEGLELTRVTLVDEMGEAVYDEFVKPKGPITDYRSAYSGITPEILQNVKTTLADVQAKIVRLLKSGPPTYLVGHALDGDLRALRLLHPLLIDTVALYPHPRGAPYKRSLKELARELLGGGEIQQGRGTSGHRSEQDAATALELAMLKIIKGHEFYVPGPWAHEPSPPREPIFKSISRAWLSGGESSKEEQVKQEAPSSASSIAAAAAAAAAGSKIRRRKRIEVLGPREGGVLGGNPSQEEKPAPTSSLVRVWSNHARGYRREGDSTWIANRIAAAAAAAEGGGEGEVSVGAKGCGSAKEIIETATQLLSSSIVPAGDAEDEERSSPDLLWMELPFRDYYTTLDENAALDESRHFTTLEEIDVALSQLAAKAEEGTLLIVALQGDLYPLYDLMETKQRCRWDKPSEAYVSIAGVGTSHTRQPWSSEDERTLAAHAADALNGVAFLGIV